MPVLVYGYSDDLIEIEGDISEELSAYDGKTNRLTFSNGVILDISYGDDGNWRITNQTPEYESLVAITPITDPEGNGPASDENGYPTYSNFAHIKGSITGVKHETV